ncbi:hypothetical protein HK098_003484 [Nowakowskiella sp. JEL0407]|nr:hypothetical protein HK098_003484 [Nowakowskiella sp. JEL0407]
MSSERTRLLLEESRRRQLEVLQKKSQKEAKRNDSPPPAKKAKLPASVKPRTDKQQPSTPPAPVQKQKNSHVAFEDLLKIAAAKSNTTPASSSTKAKPLPMQSKIPVKANPSKTPTAPISKSQNGVNKPKNGVDKKPKVVEPVKITKVPAQQLKRKRPDSPPPSKSTSTLPQTSKKIPKSTDRLPPPNKPQSAVNRPISTVKSTTSQPLKPRPQPNKFKNVESYIRDDEIAGVDIWKTLYGNRPRPYVTNMHRFCDIA